MQPSGSVAKWDGDQLTFWGMGQGIYPPRAGLADALGIDPSKIRFINKWNGSTFGSGRLAAERFYPLIAHLAKVTGRPVKVMLPKDQELAQLVIKPETITKFKVGVKKDGRITAIHHEVYVSVGELEFGVHADGPGNAFNPVGAVHVAGSALAIVVVRVPDQCAASRALAQPHPAGDQVVLGKHDGRDGRGRGHGSGRVPPDAHHPAQAWGHAPSVRIVRLRGGAPGRSQGLRMGQEKSSGGRRAGKIQARIRPRNVAASRRPDGLSRRRGSIRSLGRGARRECFQHRIGTRRPTAT